MGCNGITEDAQARLKLVVVMRRNPHSARRLKRGACSAVDDPSIRVRTSSMPPIVIPVPNDPVAIAGWILLGLFLLGLSS